MWLIFHVTVITAEMHDLWPQCAIIQSLVFINVQLMSMNVSGYNIFPHSGIKLRTFASHAFSGQMLFSQIASLLPDIAWQQNVMEYFWEGSTSTAIPPISACDITGQHNEEGGIIFAAVLTALSSGVP